VTCPNLETIAAYTLDELGEDELRAFEEHYFGCDACLAQAERMHRLVRELEATLPSVLTTARRKRIESVLPRPKSVDVQPGGRATIRLAADEPIAFWVMHAPLADAERVDFEARDDQGTTLFTLKDIPFDRERGEVVLACQVHFRTLPGVENMRASLVATDAKGSRTVGEYRLDHRFESP
jgi:hypothetical protein